MCDMYSKTNFPTSTQFDNDVVKRSANAAIDGTWTWEDHRELCQLLEDAVKSAKDWRDKAEYFAGEAAKWKIEHEKDLEVLRHVACNPSGNPLA